MKRIAFALAVGLALNITTAPASYAAACVRVKSVVGKNYQTAQDIWRAQGFTVLPAKDGKGLGRLAWNDSNWKVISQSPKANTCVKKYSSVRATIVKYTD